MRNPFQTLENEFQMKNGAVRGHSRAEEDGDAWWFAGSAKGGSLKLSVDAKKVSRFFLFLSLAIAILGAWTFYLQAIRGGYYRGIAEGNRIRIKTVKANRGVIFDRSGELLTRNIPNFYLAAIPVDLPKKEAELNRLIGELTETMKSVDGSVSPEELENIVKTAPSYSYDPVIIQDNINYDQALLLKIKAADLPGIVVEAQATREYLSDQSMSHLLGYVGKITKPELEANAGKNYLFNDYIGKSGLELSYEGFLRGTDGKKRVEVNSRGLETKVLDYQAPVTGNNLALSVDAGLQKAAAAALQGGMKKAGVQRGVAIAMDPRDGELLAMVSLPDFDNNLFARGISVQDYKKLNDDPNNPFLSRAVAGEYPPGSIFKPIMAAAGLEEKVIDKNTSFGSTGGLRVGIWFYPDWKAGGHGLTNVTKALAESVNTFFYIIGGGLYDSGGKVEIFPGLGLEKIVSYAKLFGLSQPTGVDLPSERTGFLPTKEWKEEVKGETWYLGDTYHLSIGQGDLLVTPLQVVNYTAAIANGGTLYQPRLVGKITDSDGQPVKESEPVVIRSDFIGQNSLDIVRQGMRQTVLTGSARSFSSLPFSVAAKTGTAQVGGDKNTHAWFTCFAPYDHPEIAVTVLVENGGEGSVAAAPVAREILEYYFQSKAAEQNNAPQP